MYIWEHHIILIEGINIFKKCKCKYDIWFVWHQEQEFVEEQENLRASVRDPGSSDSEPPQWLLPVCW